MGASRSEGDAVNDSKLVEDLCLKWLGLERRKTRREGGPRCTGRWIVSVWIGGACVAAARGHRKSELRRWGNRKASILKGGTVIFRKHDAKKWRPVPAWVGSPLMMEASGIMMGMMGNARYAMTMTGVTP